MIDCRLCWNDMTTEELDWKECVAQAVKSGDLGDVMTATATMDRALCSSGSGALEAEDRQIVIDLVKNEKAASPLRQHAIKALTHARDGSEETVKLVAGCFSAKTPGEAAAEASKYFLSLSTDGVCAFSKVSETIRAVADASGEAALRIVECVLAGLKGECATAWRKDATAMYCLGLLPKMLESSDIVIVLNAAELLDDTEKWNDEEIDAEAQIPAVSRLAASTSGFGLVRVGAIRALGGIAARGPKSFDASIRAGIFAQLQKLMAQEEGEEDIAIAAMTALSHAVSTAGVNGIRSILDRHPDFIDTLLLTEEKPWAGNMTHLMLTHAAAHILCSPGRDSADGSNLLKTALFEKLRPNPTSVINDSVKMACSSQEDRSRAGTHFLTSLSFHSWGVDALLLNTAFTGMLLVRDYPFFTRSERFLIAKNLLHFHPEYEQSHPELGLLVSKGPSYLPSTPIVKSDHS